MDGWISKWISKFCGREGGLDEEFFSEGGLDGKEVVNFLEGAFGFSNTPIINFTSQLLTYYLHSHWKILNSIFFICVFSLSRFIIRFLIVLYFINSLFKRGPEVNKWVLKYLKSVFFLSLLKVQSCKLKKHWQMIA